MKIASIELEVLLQQHKIMFFDSNEEFLIEFEVLYVHFFKHNMRLCY